MGFINFLLQFFSKKSQVKRQFLFIEDKKNDFLVSVQFTIENQDISFVGCILEKNRVISINKSSFILLKKELKKKIQYKLKGIQKEYFIQIVFDVKERQIHKYKKQGFFHYFFPSYDKDDIKKTLSHSSNYSNFLLYFNHFQYEKKQRNNFDTIFFNSKEKSAYIFFKVFNVRKIDHIYSKGKVSSGSLIIKYEGILSIISILFNKEINFIHISLHPNQELREQFEWKEELTFSRIIFKQSKYAKYSVDSFFWFWNVSNKDYYFEGNLYVLPQNILFLDHVLEKKNLYFSNQVNIEIIIKNKLTVKSTGLFLERLRTNNIDSNYIEFLTHKRAENEIKKSLI